MSETHATAPVFPPGRYGRRRDGRRHLAVPIAVLAVVLAGCTLIAVRLYQQYGDAEYGTQIIGWTATSTTQVTIEFTVRVPAGGAATCYLTAQTYDGTQVGERTVTVRAAAGATSIDAHTVVTTTARTAVGKVVRCQAPG